MGGLKSDPAVRDHFKRYPDERTMLRPLLSGFTLTWADRRTPANADLSVFFLRADKDVEDLFCFTQEILAIYSPHRELQSRAFQGLDVLLSELPARGRVDPLTCIIVSNDPDTDNQVVNYLELNRESRLYVGFSSHELKEASDGWIVKNRLMRRLYGRDLFDHRLPLKSDTYFFGRDGLVQEFQQAFVAGENRGLFGLRKTGKTSLFYKLQRITASHSKLRYFYYDCKLPSVRMLSWAKLLQKIGNELARTADIAPMSKDSEGPQCVDEFMRISSGLPAGIIPVLVFDEIEYITPYAKLDVHWANDYVPFWQTIWAAQSARPMPVLVCGVSPSVVEVPLVGNVQNPLFGIIPSRYLTGLGNAEVRRMLLSLGGRMGLQFGDDASTYIHRRYGGHPFLTRLACSLVHRSLQADEVERPKHLDVQALSAFEDMRDAELAFYCGHVVSELKEFYPDEYGLLETIATGQTAEYAEFYRQPEFVTHLTNYGLVQRDARGIPGISIPVVGHYVGLQAARSEGRKSILKVVPINNRSSWLSRRIRAIIDDMRALESLTRRPGGLLLFGPNSFPEADKLMVLSVCENESDFANFVNTLNRCFVESIEKYGVSIGNRNYFWNDVKARFPGLWDALNRIKVYRHNRVHLMLNPEIEETLSRYLRHDLEGRPPSSVDELWFVLQQCVLDSLFLGVQAEVERLQ